jgi:pimeloyl-ACP methyl ester carboxylesterase
MKKIPGRVFLAVLALFGAGLAVGAGVLLWLSPGKTPAFKGEGGREVAGSVATLEKIRLGGTDQWINIRGLRSDAPVVLVVHGGPGSPELAAFRAYNADLEKDLVMVQWEQRGAGKSFDPALGSNDMLIERFVEDGVALSEILVKRFGRKIAILGHSWGSYLGVRIVQERPDLFLAYVGIGQVNDFIASEKESWRFTLDEARRRGDAKAVKALEGLGSPPWRDDADLAKIGTQRAYLVKYGGAIYGKSDYGLMISSLAGCREYTVLDKVNYLRGSFFSLKAMWWQLNALGASLTDSAPRFQVPVFFFIGRHDRNVSAKGSADYFDKIRAPRKELVWFENSAHMPPFEEPAKFNAALLQRLKGL